MRLAVPSPHGLTWIVRDWDGGVPFPDVPGRPPTVTTLRVNGLRGVTAVRNGHDCCVPRTRDHTIRGVPDQRHPHRDPESDSRTGVRPRVRADARSRHRREHRDLQRHQWRAPAAAARIPSRPHHAPAPAAGRPPASRIRRSRFRKWPTTDRRRRRSTSSSNSATGRSTCSGAASRIARPAVSSPRTSSRCSARSRCSDGCSCRPTKQRARRRSRCSPTPTGSACSDRTRPSSARRSI